jgi:hypothetical protein
MYRMLRYTKWKIKEMEEGRTRQKGKERKKEKRKKKKKLKN